MNKLKIGTMFEYDALGDTSLYIICDEGHGVHGVYKDPTWVMWDLKRACYDGATKHYLDALIRNGRLIVHHE